MLFKHDEGSEAKELDWEGRWGIRACPGSAVILGMLANALEQRQITLDSALENSLHPPHWLPSACSPLPLTLRVGAPGNHQDRLLVTGGRSGPAGSRRRMTHKVTYQARRFCCASSQPWPELMNLGEQSCLLFVCHFEVFWLIKIYASMRIKSPAVLSLRIMGYCHPLLTECWTSYKNAVPSTFRLNC